MIIAERTLYATTNTNPRVPITVRLFSPVQNKIDWSCSYEIDWPTGKRAQKIHGLDGMQAIILALQMIGSDLYASKYHDDGSLFLEQPGNGYGFPVAHVMRDALIGDDKRFFG